MAELKNLIVNGSARVNGDLYTDGFTGGSTTGATSGTVTLRPGVYTVVDTVAGALTFATSSAGAGSEFEGQFTMGSSIYSVTIPGTTLAGRPSIRANHTYVFSIKNGITVLAETA